MMKRPREHDDKHLQFIRELPCAVCTNNIETEAAHVRMSDARAAKLNAGVGAKPHDRWTVPLCGKHHREQHECGDERKFWSGYDIDPIFVALALWSISGDYEAGTAIVVHHSLLSRAA